MSDNIDQASFASILAGVRKMRQAYEPNEETNIEQAPAVEQSQVRQTSSDSSSAPALPTSHSAAATSSTPGDAAREGSSVSPGPAVTRTSPANILSPHTAAPVPTQIRQRPQDRARRGDRGNVHSYTSVQVAHSQKANPLLESPAMKAMPWSFNGQILLDYYINATVQVLFLTLKYDKLRPEYVWRRIEKLRGGSVTGDTDDETLRVLLVVVDIDSPQEALRKLLVVAIKNDLSMVVAWSFEEAGNYVAALKQNELARSKVESAIQGVKKGDYNSNVVNTLTTVRAVNKTDVANLLANCKSFKEIVLLSTKENGLAGIPGLGVRKIQNLHSAFSEPFIFNKDYKV